MRYETPYVGPLELFARYDPKRELGAMGQPAAPAPCPKHPLWWLLAAFGAGAALGFGFTKKDKRRRRGRIE